MERYVKVSDLQGWAKSLSNFLESENKFAGSVAFFEDEISDGRKVAAGIIGANVHGWGEGRQTCALAIETFSAEELVG